MEALREKPLTILELQEILARGIRAGCANQYERSIEDESLSYCRYTDKCCEGECECCASKELICPHCDLGLNYRKDLNYWYCPDCQEWAYDASGEVIMRID